uniref:Uncharacterized protein n=1 Tax=Oryza sativa subsp. japonica TaxID=39947 RepID=Q2QME4_ORYSJ|nr:hypothetical protein LOC_Os12g41410 [Oryza sativa Japonica Group]
MASQHLILLLAIFVSLCVAAIGQGNKIVPFNPSCSTTGNYSGDSQYKKNLDQLLSTLATAATDDGWFNTSSVGTGGDDQVFGLIMCYADRNPTQCKECLAGAPAGITQVCPGSRTVNANYDACLLRYSDVSFFSVADKTVAFNVYAKSYVENMAAMNETRWQLMSQLAETAGQTKLRLDTGSTRLGSTSMMYGLAQCTRDLAVSECSTCLSDYIVQLSKIFPNNSWAAIKGYSCYLRYDLSPFGITLPPSSPVPPPSSTRSTGFVAGLSVAGAVSFMVILGVSIWLLLRRRRKHARLMREHQEMEDDFEKGTRPKRFRYDELSVATDFFSDDCKLGEGGFGSKQGRKEYESEVRIISRLRHRNLVQLIGWCHDGSELLLVYELMPNASLDTHLYNANANVLPWPLSKYLSIYLSIYLSSIYLSIIIY